jgi:SNF2 family DNA or RNA helicase
MLDGFMLKRNTEDVMKDLPKIFMQDVVVEPGEVELDGTFFTSYVTPIDRRDQLMGIIAAEEAKLNSTNVDDINALMATCESVSTLRKFTGLQKVQPVIDMIKKDFDEGLYSKLVIFAIHRDVINNLVDGLREYGITTIHGGTPAMKRQNHVNKFQNNPECRIFIGNIQAAGTNITLTASYNLIMIEQSWVPGENAQAIKRCNRIGSMYPLNVRVIGLANSIDGKIAETLRRKTQELTQLFDDKSDDYVKMPEADRKQLQKEFLDAKNKQNQLAKLLE